MDYKALIAEALAEKTRLSREDITALIEEPADEKLGDFAFPCFRLAKELRKAPPAIAADLAAGFEKPAFVEKVVSNGAYLNFFLDKGAYCAGILGEVLKRGAEYGSAGAGRGKTVTIDYSSPNIAKQLHIGHLYTTVIGAALYRIYKHLGYNAVGINYLGDWGTQFGKMIVAYKRFGDAERLDRDGVTETNRIYVKFHEEAESDPSLNTEARAWLLKMQQGDEEALALWGKFREITIRELEKTYSRMGITFDSYRGESYYNDKMTPVVEELREKGLLTESDGAMIVDLSDYKLPPCLILRGDGGTLYPTRDIAAAIDRKETYNFHKSLYITDVRQAGHFAQFFKVLELMGMEWAADLIHIPYGLLSIEGGALSSRHGNVVLLEDLFDEARERVLKIIDEKNPNLPDKETVAEEVGQGAIVFASLYNNRIKDVDFYWDRILNFEGETGPYAQYTYARCCGVLEKAGAADWSAESADLTLINEESAFAVCRLIAAFPAKLEEAADKYEPYLLSRHIMSVCQEFNRFYHNHSVLNAETEELKAARLALTLCVKTVLGIGLRLLGVAAPGRM